MKENTEVVHRRLNFSATGNVQPTREIGNKEEEAVPARYHNRSSQKGKALNYIPPIIRDGTVVVQIDDEETKEQENYWSTALIGYVLGDNPYEKAMENYIVNVWDFADQPQILYHDEGYFVFRFQNMVDRDLVLHNGPYTYHNKPLILQCWSVDFKFDPSCSAVGKPLYTDKFTAELEKISFARVLVEADISRPLPDSVNLQTSRGIINQQIEYDWKPKFCCDCVRFGHNSEDCWLKNKQEGGEEIRKQPQKQKNKNKENLKWVPKVSC
ncbi:uncharacterized protein [Nicotiana sylvestris]|uniref:uncharacterized protein n=1 Tax=Nicotiana sylvestris TaxID=4096 RepID=UPI00388C684F